MSKNYSILLIFVSFIFLSACARSDKEAESLTYPRKPADTSSRKAGAAMLLYEQAEKDADVNENVEVIPPKDKTASDKKE